MTLSTQATSCKDNGKLADLQHRHFATIATIIAAMPHDILRRQAALHFADMLPRTNAKFDQARFLRACGE